MREQILEFNQDSLKILLAEHYKPILDLKALASIFTANTANENFSASAEGGKKTSALIAGFSSENSAKVTRQLRTRV